MADPPRFPDGESLGYLVVRAGERFLRGYTERMAAEGLTVRQSSILGIVAQHEGIAAAGIARRLDVSPQSMVGQIESLCRRGLLRRDANPGPGRPIGVHVTREGRAVLRRAGRLAEAYEAQLTADMTLQERRAFAAALRSAMERA